MNLQISQNDYGWTCQKKLQNLPGGLFLLAFGLGLIIVGLVILLVGHAFIFSFSNRPPTLLELLNFYSLIAIFLILLFGLGFIIAGFGSIYYGIQCFNRYTFHIDNKNVLHFSVQPIATSKSQYLALENLHSWRFSVQTRHKKQRLVLEYQDQDNQTQELFHCDREDFAPEECKVLIAALSERSRV